MPVDPMLSQYSDLLFKGALTVYVLAMAFYAVEYVTSRARERAVAAEAAPEPAAVAAVSATGGTGTADLGTVSEENADVPPPPVKAPKPFRSRADRFGRMGVSLTILAVLLHLGSIALRGLAAGRWPLGNMYEFTSAVCFAAMVAWLVALQRTSKRTRGLRKLGVFVLVPVLILMFLAGTVLYAQAAPVVPALQSYWLAVHVTTVTLASGLFFVPGVASILYLMKRSGKPAGFVAKLPDADVLDRLAYRVTVVAFPMYTFAVIAGAIWAEAAWGRFWGWDPKETVAFVAWVIYAAYLHARATAGWRHVGAAWINILGLAAIIFNLFFINMVVAGLHSYAGLG
ncbi:c-type cytochrome biogenesis protein CcsB [Pseudonocardia sp. RS11V-5]|uniref:c-type cytochrome biogenesis protein CcsB n=1 Tax=Pseudonocardia terrae TaxID=2905831 RepID=UPI001E2A3E51|nr:c-type cytochrome biogenesis protein CcsB [Pseudonocardia terrae]MCE3553211.1 c-type cytochrome biogenesis protein CcsB [Pseudonocardia terrae]